MQRFIAQVRCASMQAFRLSLVTATLRLRNLLLEISIERDRFESILIARNSSVLQTEIDADCATLSRAGLPLNFDRDAEPPLPERILSKLTVAPLLRKIFP